MQKVAVVTGASQGLALALVRGLCRQLGDRGVVYLTARDRRRGEAAIQQIQAEGLSPQIHLLDVADEGSVSALAAFIERQHGGVDIVIGSAAARIVPDVAPAQQVLLFSS